MVAPTDTSSGWLLGKAARMAVVIDVKCKRERKRAFDLHLSMFLPFVNRYVCDWWDFEEAYEQ